MTADVLPKERPEAFADGVLAIVITILVLELHVPETAAGQSLLQALGDQWRMFAGYVISFVFVGGVWIAHSNATRLIARGDAILFRLNLLALFFVSLLPFTTSLMTSHLGDSGEGVAVAIYGVDLFIASLMLNAFLRYAASKPELIANEIADHELAAIVRQRRSLLAAQGAATLVAFALPNVAVLLNLLARRSRRTTPAIQREETHARHA
jgi:uncharacterized membrane protein